MALLFYQKQLTFFYFCATVCQSVNQKDSEMKQNEIKVLEEEKATLSHAIADEIKKRDTFIVKQNIIIDDLYAQYEMVEAKLNGALRDKNQKIK